jgi:hypothetical protein
VKFQLTATILVAFASVGMSCDKRGSPTGSALAASVTSEPLVPSAPPLEPDPPSWSPLIPEFVAWTNQAFASPRGVGKREECLGPSDYAPGLCMRMQGAPDHVTAWDLSYFPKFKDSARATAVFINSRIPCGAFGANEVVRSWRYASLLKSHCRLTSGALSGKELLVQQTTAATAGGDATTTVHVFTRNYLDHDPGFRHVIEEEVTGIRR